MSCISLNDLNLKPEDYMGISTVVSLQINCLPPGLALTFG